MEKHTTTEITNNKCCIPTLILFCSYSFEPSALLFYKTTILYHKNNKNVFAKKLFSFTLDIKEYDSQKRKKFWRIITTDARSFALGAVFPLEPIGKDLKIA